MQFHVYVLVLATFKGIKSGKYKRHFFGGRVEPNCRDMRKDKETDNGQDYIEGNRVNYDSRRYVKGNGNKTW